jgi:hypothetical protein
MSKKADREKAEREGTFKQRQEHKDDKRYLCPFPNCGRAFWRESGKPDCCPLHRQMIQDVGFIIAHLKPVPKTQEPPGGPADKPAEGKTKILVIGDVKPAAARIIADAAASLDEATKAAGMKLEP